MINIWIEQGLSKESRIRPIREEVFIDEQGFQEEFDHIDSYAAHLLLLEDNEPAAVGRIYPKEAAEDTYIIGRIAVRKKFRAHHLGSQVVKALEDYALTRRVKCLELSAQVRVKEFYERNGYQCVGEEYYDEFCPHIKMVKYL